MFVSQIPDSDPIHFESTKTLTCSLVKKFILFTVWLNMFGADQKRTEVEIIRLGPIVNHKARGGHNAVRKGGWQKVCQGGMPGYVRGEVGMQPSFILH